MIEAQGLTKKYGDRVAVSDLSFTVRPGAVTGFLGPNGAGKSTTMRMILGLDRPTSGKVTVNGRPFADHPDPLAVAGALLDARAFQASRSAYDHLRAIAATHGLPKSRVSAVIEQVGLTEVAHKRVGGFSLGMGQRLGIAVALLGDPEILILDEPVNGLDPEGVRWVRRLLRDFVANGRTVLLSSHLMSEMELTADHLLIIGRGTLIADVSMAELKASIEPERILVRTPRLNNLRSVLIGPNVQFTPKSLESAEISGMSLEDVSKAALAASIPLTELTPLRASLEDIFIGLTADAVEYQSPEDTRALAA